MSTSNLVKAIGMYRLDLIVSAQGSLDSAFIDRADIVQYVDLPPREAIYEILRTSLCEMISKGVIASIVRPFIDAVMYNLMC